MDLISVYRDTKEYIKANVKENFKSYKKSDLKHEGIYKGICKGICKDTTKVVVWKKDILESAIVLKKIGFNPVVLNPASKEYPGGSVEYGSKAQEEEIFRRTDYCLHLTNDLYPISNPTSIIYSKNVSIIKDINYNYLKNPHYKVDFIACAASLSLDGTLNDKQFEKTRYKIRLIFSSAVEEGRDSIILSALGCGVCNNPVVKIVQIFKEVIEEYKYFFEIIVFSINDHNYKYFLKINE